MNHTLQEIPLSSLNVGNLAKASCVPISPTSLIPGLPDKYTVLFAPVVVYWGFSLTFHLCDYYGLLSKYKMHTPTEFLQRNKVPMRTVIRGVLIQQAFQTIAGAIFAWNDAEELISCERRDVAAYALSIRNLLHLALPLLNIVGMKNSKVLSIPLCVYLAEIFYKAIIPTFQLVLAIFFLDSWQYWLHYNMHKRRWLYRHVHSRHHLLYVPYAFGAFYNHPVEWLLGDTVASLAAFKVARMTMRQGTLLFVLATLKTVDDHSGFKLPWDPFQWVTDNNAYYHDIHHQSWGMTVSLLATHICLLRLTTHGIIVQPCSTVHIILGSCAWHKMDGVRAGDTDQVRQGKSRSREGRRVKGCRIDGCRFEGHCREGCRVGDFRIRVRHVDSYRCGGQRNGVHRTEGCCKRVRQIGVLRSLSGAEE